MLQVNETKDLEFTFTYFVQIQATLLIYRYSPIRKLFSLTTIS